MSSDTRAIVLDAVKANPGSTDIELQQLTGLDGNRLRPARQRAWLDGLIEPTSENGWKRALKNVMKTVGWHTVPPERHAEVAERAATRMTRNVRTPHARAKQIVEWSKDPATRRLASQMLDDLQLSKRHRSYADAELRRQAREQAEDAKAAAREGRDDAEIQRKVKMLWDARGLLATVCESLVKDAARAANDEEVRVEVQRWTVAIPNAYSIMLSIGGMWKVLCELGTGAEKLPCPCCGVPPKISEDRHLSNGHIDVDEYDDVGEAEVVED